MASELTRPPNIDVSDLTDSDLRISASFHAQYASSLKEILRLRTSLLGANHELGELRKKLHNAERTSTEGQHELNSCKERLHAVEDELQKTKCELEELKSGRADMELRLESAETSLKAAERLLGEYVVKNDQLEASQKPVPGSSTRIDASVATEPDRKRARSPSLEIIDTSCSSRSRAKGVSVKKSLESTPSRTSLPLRRSASRASYLPTPPPASNVEECTVLSAKRRKIGMDDEVDSGGNSMSIQLPNTAPRVNDTANVSTDVPPVTSLSSNSDSDGTEAPSHHKGTETTDSMDVEPAMAEPRSATHAGSSPLATLRATAQTSPLPSTNVPSQPAPTTSSSQLTTMTAQTQPSSTSVRARARERFRCSYSPQWNRAQPTAVNVPPPCTTTRAAPVTMANVPAHGPLDDVAPPSSSSADVIRDVIVGTTAKPLPPAPTTVGICGSDEPPAYSASTSHDKGKQTDNSLLTTPASTKTQQVSLQTARPGIQASTSNAATTSSVLNNPKNPAHNKLLPDTVQRRTDEPHFLDTSSMLPAVASMVQKYLPSTKAKIFPISPSPLKTEVPRAFLRATFGGAEQQFLQIFRKDKHAKGAIVRRAVFPKFGLNPAMPGQPGQPGLVFASRHEILENPPWSVFRKRLSASGKAVWLYLGDYESELMGKMSGEEFSGLATSVKRGWANALLEVKKFDVYVSMRARIALRKDLSIPLEDKNEEKALIDEEIRAIRMNKGRPVGVNDLVGALERGDEGIDIIRMICIGYDLAFAKDMTQKFVADKASSTSASATSEPSSSISKGSGKNVASSAAAMPKPPTAPMLQDKPFPTSRHPEEESEADENDDSDFEFDASLPKEPSDRELRPRASRVITIED